MKIEEAIRAAIEYETRILDVYTLAAQAVADARGKKVLGMLADEEKGHVAYLKGKLKQWQDQGILRFDSLPSQLPSIDSIRAEASNVSDDFSGKPLAKERQILERALKAEIETSRFYEGLVAGLTGDGQRMFARFLEIENEHLQLVQAELDFITRSGFWFDFPEIDLEAIDDC
jgi:rubrerythrin